MEDLVISQDFLHGLVFGMEGIYQSLSIFSHISKEKIVLSLAIFSYSIFLFYNVQVFLLDGFVAQNKIFKCSNYFLKAERLGQMAGRARINEASGVRDKKRGTGGNQCFIVP